MIRRIILGLSNLINLFLPPIKRQPVRLAWLRGLLICLMQDEQSFILWRDEMIIRAKVTGQKGSLQWYLNHLFDPVLFRILIIEGILTGGVILSLEGENVSSLPKDFRVMIPAGVDPYQIGNIVDLYNAAHRSYDIVTF